jgi:SpoVK/Ycf46/Vps4 family AAA+-type ATPase
MVDIVRYYRESNKNVLSFFYLHTILIGNPGTGKTTVARILSKLYKALGILERGHMVETDRQGLVAGFVGQTAIKTAEKIDESLGGVLFIDEAYALSNFNGLQGDFGNEAIQTLLKRMEDLRGEFFVFVAGYPDNMDTFLKANPGLSSRFDKTLRFDDYNADQLYQIAVKMIKDEGYTLEAEASKNLISFLETLYIGRDKFFGNARTVRKIIFELIKNQNLRVKSKDKLKRKKSDLTMITSEDVALVIQHYADDTKSMRQSIGYRPA